MPLKRQLFRVPKMGNSLEECEDYGSVVVEGDGAGEAVTSCFAAIADGASESLLAGEWAAIVASEAVESMRLIDSWWLRSGAFSESLIRRTSSAWDLFLSQYHEERRVRGRPIQWYERPGLEKGAFATIVGVSLQAMGPAANDDGAWEWNAFALGDSCLFHLAAGAVKAAFPIDNADLFDASPKLIGSRNSDAALLAQRVAFCSGELNPGESVVLASDALSAWLLSRDARNANRAQELLSIMEDGEGSFSDWVTKQREGPFMRNDDVSLIRLSWDASRS